MDWRFFGASCLVVYGILAVSGMILSLFSTQLQCSKINFLDATKQGFVFGFMPTIMYALASSLAMVRSPFTTTLESFGVPASQTQVMGVGYLVMIMSWMASVTLNNSSEKAVCVASVREMSEFKKNLLAKLQQKEDAKEKNQEPTPPPYTK
jgi:hypothetical protein